MPAPAEPVCAAIAAHLAQWPENRVAVVGFSGGLDSTVLLHAVTAALGPDRVVAAHVHHGLQTQADDWATRTATVAREYGCRYELTHLTPPASAPAGGIEQWARQARRTALLQWCCAYPPAMLLLAHHADDQVETLLMNWGRGAGPAGMGGMPEQAQEQGFELLRPLLKLSRQALANYASHFQLDWVQDPSNTETRYRRNRLRHQVLPLLDDVFPGFRRNVLRNAELTTGLTIELTRALQASPLQTPAGKRFDRRRWQQEPPEVIDSMLHRWLRGLGRRAPTLARTRHMREQLMNSSAAHAQIRHDAEMVRRYRDRIELTPDWDDPPASAVLVWRGENTLDLPGFAGCLRFSEALEQEAGLAGAQIKDEPLCLTPLIMSARLREHPQTLSRSLKQLCQEQAIAPWERRRLPMLRLNGKTLFAAGQGMNAEATEMNGAGRVKLSFEPHQIN